MIGALLLLVIGIPITLWVSNGFNGFLSGAPSYSQIENTTAFYEGPFVDGVETEGRFASVNSTTVTAETPTWDTSDEWDSIVLTSTEAENKVIFNWNMSVEDLLNSKISQFRIKLNTTKELKISFYAVKWDDATLTKVLAYSIPHIGADNSTVYWNITASDVLNIKSGLAPAITDEVYFQIIIDGYDDDNHLTTADTITFQFATAEPSNAYSFSHYQVLKFTAFLMGAGLFFVGFASTKYFNPLMGKVRSSTGGRKKSKGRKRSRKRRR